MWAKSSSGLVARLLELIPTKRTPEPACLSAVARVTSSEPITYGQWLQVKNTTSTGASAKDASDQVRPSVAGSEKSGALAPSGRVKGMAPPWGADARPLVTAANDRRRAR